MQRLLSSPVRGQASPRVLFVVAHPDDETIGAASRLTTLRDVHVLCVTDGAPRSGDDARTAGFRGRASYRRQRRREMEAALACAGVPRSRLHFVGMIDQEASRALVDLTRAVRREIQRLQPDAVLTHPYEGGHPDHDAAAFAVAMALRWVARGGGRTPAAVEFTSYHREADSCRFGAFLPHESADSWTIALEPDERWIKRAMLACYASQRRVWHGLSLECERFRFAPTYDFTRAPHAGELWYERMPWGMSGITWRALAADAMRRLRRHIANGENFSGAQLPARDRAA